MTAVPSSRRDNHAEDNDVSLRQRTQAFLRRWREQLGGGWQARQASGLYDDLEQLAALAEAKGVAEVADPALELAIYLCSFIDTEAAPNPAQRHGLDRLVEQLAANGNSKGERSHRKAVASGHAARQIFYLCEEARVLPGLATRLGEAGCIVRPFVARDRVLVAMDEIIPDILLVDEGFVAEVHALTEAAQRKRPAHRDVPLCVVLAEQTDHTRTLFAQRAGAETIVTERDPVALASRLDQLLAQRRAQDFRVLIVEDDRVQAKFCDSILRHCGMVTGICADASQVAPMLSEFKPDLVLLDLYLPTGNGIEVAQRIREHAGNAFLPIVFLTGEHDQDLRFDAIRAGADDFITKPVKPRHLVTAVESRIRRARELRTRRSKQPAERRGILSSREALATEILRVAHAEPEKLSALVCVAVDDAERIAQNLGFVTAGMLPQQIAAALAAEITGERVLCVWGEVRFLALLQDWQEASLREMLEELRRKLDARLWLSDEMPLRLHFSIGCLRVPAEITKVDEVLAAARTLCEAAQQAGGARCEFDLRRRGGEHDEDPRRRLLRALLRAPSWRGASRLGFQPVVPLSGQITGQYEARVELAPERFAHSLQLKREDYLPIARELHMSAQADRQTLRILLERARDNDGKHSLRLHVPICVDTALEQTFAAWLATELRAHHVSGGTLVLVFAGGELHTRLPTAKPALESLQRLGLRLAAEVHGSDHEITRNLLQVETLAVMRFVRPGDGAEGEVWNGYAALFKEARSLGKTVVACGVQQVGELTGLLRLGTHYVQGDVLAGWSADLNYEFPAVI